MDKILLSELFVNCKIYQEHNIRHNIKIDTLRSTTNADPKKCTLIACLMLCQTLTKENITLQSNSYFKSLHMFKVSKMVKVLVNMVDTEKCN